MQVSAGKPTLDDDEDEEAQNEDEEAQDADEEAQNEDDDIYCTDEDNVEQNRNSPMDLQRGDNIDFNVNEGFALPADIGTPLRYAQNRMNRTFTAPTRH